MQNNLTRNELLKIHNRAARIRNSPWNGAQEYLRFRLQLQNFRDKRTRSNLARHILALPCVRATANHDRVLQT